MLDAPDHLSGGGEGQRPRPLETTAVLIIRARNGEERAITDLVRRFTPAVRSMAHGKLSGPGRERYETQDLVQIAFTRAFNKMNGFEPKGPGAFLAYLRQIVRRLVVDEYRRGARQPKWLVLDPDMEDGSGTPLDRIAGTELEARYRTALYRLNAEQQIAVSLYVEWSAGIPVIMEAIGSPSPNAARMVLTRGLIKLAKEMDGGEG